jgi:hypothetical protein
MVRRMPFVVPTLVSLMLASSAHAAPSPRVLVTNFEARNRSMAATAEQLPGAVIAALDATHDARVVTIDQVPSVSDMSAVMYSESCPPGQFIGCSFVLGEAAGVDFVLAGAVEEIRGGVRVELHILDVRRAEDVLGFQTDFARADDEVFAQGVAAVIGAVARGEVELTGDIRAVVDPGAGAQRERDRVVAERQIATLEREIGDVESVDRRERRQIERETVSMEDLVEDIDSEAAKPWERIDMTVQEYLRFKNSNMPLHEWRKRSQGRKAQLIIRPQLGFGKAPVDQRYYAKSLHSATDFSTLETWNWQVTQHGSGLLWGVGLSYGLLPMLEVGVVAGGATGKYYYQVQKQTEGNEPVPIPEDSSSNSSYFFGPEFLVALMPTSPIRPVFGGGFSYWKGTAAGDHVQLPAYFKALPAGTALVTSVRVGGELRLSDVLDLYIHLPVTMVVGGKTTIEYYDGTGLMERTNTAPVSDTVGAGVLLGFQVRLLGPKEKTGMGGSSGPDPD